MTPIDPRARLEGWQTIAMQLGRSVSWCQKQARLDVPKEQRLPVWYLSRGPERGRPCVTLEDLAAWLDRCRRAERPGNGATEPVEAPPTEMGARVVDPMDEFLYGKAK